MMTLREASGLNHEKKTAMPVQIPTNNAVIINRSPQLGGITEEKRTTLTSPNPSPRRKDRPPLSNIAKIFST